MAAETPEIGSFILNSSQVIPALWLGPFFFVQFRSKGLSGFVLASFWVRFGFVFVAELLILSNLLGLFVLLGPFVPGPSRGLGLLSQLRSGLDEPCP